jgi:CubicO group peptidase (beta-lactamase class C family)
MRRIMSRLVSGMSLIWLLFLAAPIVCSQTFVPALQILEQAVADGSIPGAAVVILRHGEVLEQRAFGVREFDPKRPFEVDTICWVASLTKPVTAAAAMKLTEQGKLDLDAPVANYLPQFSMLSTGDGQPHSITVRQLLSHTSGIPAAVPLRESNFFTQRWFSRTLSEVVEAIAQRPLDFRPESKVNYSNAALYVVGRVIEVCSGKTYGQFVRNEILLPLRMRDTDFFVPRENIDRTSVVYRRDKAGLSVYCRYDPTWQMDMTMPDGGLFSTPHDIALFANSFLDEKFVLLREESINAMLSQQSLGYGLGWILDKEHQFSHWGSSGTFVWADRKTGIVGVLFSQIQDFDLLAKLRNRFRDAVDAQVR